MKRKRLSFVIFVLVLISSAMLYAGSIKVSSYEFSIIGKTKESVIRNLIVPSEVESFDSEEELISALDHKKQILENKRVFKEISYEYEILDDKAYIRFEIVDAKSFLIIPYPKYDSNYGLRLGAKMWNRNLLGTFTSFDGTFYASIKDWDWSRSELYGNISMTDLYVGSAKLSFDFEIEGSIGEKLSDYSLYVDASNIPLFNTLFGIRYSLDNVNNGLDAKNNLFLSLGGANFGETEILPTFKYVFYKNETGKNYMLPALAVNNISILSMDAELRETLKLSKKEDGITYTPEYFKHENIISFRGVLEDFSLYNTINHKFKKGTDLLNEVKYDLTSVFSLYVAEDVYLNDEGSLRHFDTGVGIGESLKIGKDFVLSSKLIAYIRATSDGDCYPLYTLDVSLVGDTINWNGNYREGIAANISIKEALAIKDGGISADFDKNGIYDHFEVSYFKLIGGWFNPSCRVIVNSYLRNNPDEDNSYIWGSSGTLGEELRGIRNDSISDSNLFALVANFNLLSYFPMPSIFSFVDCYANVFFDYGLVKNNDASSFNHYFGVGLEGIGILKSYPSYPIRISLGFDISKLKKWIENRESMDFYEIYFGMGFLF
ncbi:MAG: hypothetical protein ACI4SL_03945 [Candidatus Ornithospirochaeta sp.]